MVNYGVNYRLEYCDFLGKQCRIDLLSKDYTGAIVPYSSGSEPLEISYKNDDEDKFSQITGSEAKLSIMATDNFSLQTFYVNDERQFLAQYYVNNLLKWSGFILPDSANEPFLIIPYESTLQAKDIIGTLKSVDFATDTGVLIKKQDSIKNILVFCLAKTGLNLDIWTGVNTYETTMPTGLADDPLAMTYVDTNRYIDTNNKPYSCYAVILDICNMFSANIKQSDGAWWLVDITQLKESSYNARHYDYLGNYLGRKTVANSKQAGLGKELELVDEDHSFSNILGYKSVSTYYEYGYLSNKLVNGDFNDVVPGMISLSPFYNWTSLGMLIVNKGQKTIEVPEGTMLIPDYYAIFNNKDSGKKLVSDPVSVLKTNTFDISVDMGRPADEADYIGIFNINFIFYIVLSAEGETNRYWNGNDWIESDTTFYVGEQWDRYSVNKTINFGVPNPPYSGFIKFGIIGSYADVSPNYRVVTLYIENVSLTSSESQYYKSAIGNVVTVSQFGNYSKTPETTKLLFGDDANKNRTSWMRLSNSTPTVVWSRFGKSETLKLQEIAAKNKLNQHQKTSRLFEGTLLGDLNPMDTVNVQLVDSKFFFLSGTFYSMSGKCKVKLAGLFDDDLETITKVTYEDFGDYKF